MEHEQYKYLDVARRPAALLAVLAAILFLAPAAALEPCSGYDWSLTVRSGQYLDSKTGRYVEPSDPFMGKAYKYMTLGVEVNVRITDLEECSPRTFRLDATVPEDAETGTCRPLTELPIFFTLGRQGEGASGRHTVLVEVKTGFRTGNCTVDFFLTDGGRSTRRLDIPIDLAPGDCAKMPDLERIGQVRDDARVTVQKPELLGRCGPGERPENGVCCPEGEVCCFADSQCSPFGRCLYQGAAGEGPLASYHAPARCDLNRNTCVIPPPGEWEACAEGTLCDESAQGCAPVDTSEGGLVLVDTTPRPLWYNRYPRGESIPITVALLDPSLRPVGDASVVARFEGETRELAPMPGGRYSATLPPTGMGGEYIIVAARKGELEAKHVTYVSMAGTLDLELNATLAGRGAFRVLRRALDGAGSEVADARFHAFLDGAPLALEGDGLVHPPEGSAVPVLRVCAARDHLVPALSCAEGEYCCRARSLGAPPPGLAAPPEARFSVGAGGDVEVAIPLRNEGASAVEAALELVAPPGVPEGLARLLAPSVSIPAGGEAAVRLRLSPPPGAPCRELPLAVKVSSAQGDGALPLSVEVRCPPGPTAAELAGLGEEIEWARGEAAFEGKLSLDIARMAQLQASAELALGRPDRAAALNATARQHLADARASGVEPGAAPAGNLMPAIFLSAILVAAAALIRSEA